ncbi:hypothetical protein K0M31_014507, partial [Melipona bicolor]
VANKPVFNVAKACWKLIFVAVQHSIRRQRQWICSMIEASDDALNTRNPKLEQYLFQDELKNPNPNLACQPATSLLRRIEKVDTLPAYVFSSVSSDTTTRTLARFTPSPGA